MKVSPCLTCLTTTGSLPPVVFFSSLSQPPGSLKTTTSPRCGREPNQGVSLSTSTRSPMVIVSCIEPDGMTKAWTRNVFSTRAMSTATPTSRGISFTADLRRRRFTLRASLRRSARPCWARRPGGRSEAAAASVAGSVASVAGPGGA
ncbi:hypothetical protein BX283_5767 [Streptomyces sp. TLI_146]|nr:hypothetical protein BX283_5767 [Streptomyces sp. TLI_146]